jgi:hypothetical protein
MRHLGLTLVAPNVSIVLKWSNGDIITSTLLSSFAATFPSVILHC